MPNAILFDFGSEDTTFFPPVNALSKATKINI
jgi:hypothetical protein